MKPETLPAKIETITCACGKSFEWENAGDWTTYRPEHCHECAEKIHREHEEELQRERDAEMAEQRERTSDKVLAITPPRYRQTDINHPAFNRDLWRKAKAWRPSEEVPFLGLIGASGACKTRICYLLLREIVVERVTREARSTFHSPSFAAATSSELAATVGRLWDNESKQAARRELDRIRECKILLLDDLGKAKSTPSVAAELFAIIDHRHAHNLPTIWTANSTPEEIVSGMSADMAGPLAGRLIECSTILRA